MAETSDVSAGGDGKVVEEAAYAKLNLTLEVLRRRDDGYHDVASIMQTVSLSDRVVLRESDSLEVVCTDARLAGAENSVSQAAIALGAIGGRSPNVRIEVDKRIPVAAGLGGGSADAAAVLRGLSRLWELRMTAAELREVAAGLGSDVPFLIEGGTAIVSGTGTETEQLPAADLGRAVIVAPEGSSAASHGVLKTGQMYAALHRNLYTTGSLTRRLAARVTHGGDCHSGFMFNVFQRLAPQMFPNWEAAHDALVGVGARDVILSGSGPAMFAFAASRELATLWAHLVPRRVPGWTAVAVDAVPVRPIR